MLKTTDKLICFKTPCGVSIGFFKKGEELALVDNNAPSGWLHVKGEAMEGYVAEVYVKEEKKEPKKTKKAK